MSAMLSIDFAKLANCSRVCWLFVGCTYVYSIRNRNTAFGFNFSEFSFFACRRVSKFMRSLFFLRLPLLCSQSYVIICLLAHNRAPQIYLWWQWILLSFPYACTCSEMCSARDGKQNEIHKVPLSPIIQWRK